MVVADFEVKVGAGGMAGLSDSANDLAAGSKVALFDDNLGKMGINGGVLVGMPNDD